ncbi:MAG: hypothetical protein PHE53_04175 [Thermoguttaceae bacterium]|nr:hypothetical protein [Thermoguttaceae bacterium]
MLPRRAFMLYAAGSLWPLMGNPTAFAKRNPANPELANLQPDMRYLENDRVKLGIDLSIGGAVTYLADKANGGENMINSCDWGRQIQLSYYSGPNPYIGPNGEEPMPSWAGLGWNPIQAGDAGGYPSEVTQFEYVEDVATGTRAMVVECIPKQWPHFNVPGDCTFRCVYTLSENTFKLTATIRLHRLDHTQYAGRSQEMPALYTNGPWYKLVTYQGVKPFKGEPLRTLVRKADGKGWPWTQAYIPECWSALVNDADIGVGVYQPDSMYITAGFHGGDAAKGVGGAKNGQTGYIAPLSSTVLDWNGESTYETYFIVGSLEEIRKFVYDIAPHQASTCWIFAHDRQHWVYEGTTDAGCPIENELKIACTKGTPGVMVGPRTFWRAEERKTFEMELAVEPNDGADLPESLGLLVRMDPVTPADLVDSDDIRKMPPEEQAKLGLPLLTVQVPVATGAQYQTVTADLSGLTGYTGAMKQLRVTLPLCDGTVRVKRIEIR